MASIRKFTIVSALILCASTAFADSTTLTGTVRDFTPAHPDFESGIGGLQTGLVGSTLTGSAPTLINTGSDIDSAASFAQWWGPAAPSTSHSITLSETAPGSGIYSYSNFAFFPIDGMLLGNYGGTGHNYHFTFQIAATFGYTPGAGQVFTFGGDDDVWVYFDKKLGIDLGGVHGFASQTVNLDTLFGPGKAAGNYSFDFFFAERHTSGSNLTISTSLNLVAAPVPEPETYAMLLAGLGLLGMAARRRKQHGVAAVV